MKTYTYTTTTELAADRLYRAITEITRWPEWDNEIETISHDGRLAPGTLFMLKPKGGPKVTIEIVEATAPTRFDDVTYLPLARMGTSHRFTPLAQGTRIDIVIWVRGILGFFWDLILVRKQAAGTADQVRAFLDHVARASQAIPRGSDARGSDN